MGDNIWLILGIAAVIALAVGFFVARRGGAAGAPLEQHDMRDDATSGTSSTHMDPTTRGGFNYQTDVPPPGIAEGRVVRDDSSMLTPDVPPENRER